MQIMPIKSKREFEKARRSLDTQLAEVLARRPDLIARRGGLSEQDLALLDEFPEMDEVERSG